MVDVRRTLGRSRQTLEDRNQTRGRWSERSRTRALYLPSNCNSGTVILPFT